MMRIIGLSNPLHRSHHRCPNPTRSFHHRAAPALDPKRIADLLAKDGQLILPLLDLLENAQCALDDLIDVMGRATIEAVLRMSAEAIAGPKAAGQEVRPRHRLPRHPERTRRAEGTRDRRREAPAAPPPSAGGRVGGGRDPRLRGDARATAASPSGCSRSSSPASRPDATNRSSPRWPGRWASPRARSRARRSRPANACWTTSPAATSPGSTSWPSGSTESNSAPTT